MVLAVGRRAHADAVRRIAENARAIDSRRRRCIGDRGRGCWNSRNQRVPDIRPQSAGVGGLVNLTAGVVEKYLSGRVGRRGRRGVGGEEVAKTPVDAIAGKSPFGLD